MKIDIKKLAETLCGSCDTLDEALSGTGKTDDDMTDDDWKALDEITILCTVCNWWVEAGDASLSDDTEEYVCSGCEDE